MTHAGRAFAGGYRRGRVLVARSRQSPPGWGAGGRTRPNVSQLACDFNNDTRDRTPWWSTLRRRGRRSAGRRTQATRAAPQTTCSWGPRQSGDWQTFACGPAARILRLRRGPFSCGRLRVHHEGASSAPANRKGCALTPPARFDQPVPFGRCAFVCQEPRRAGATRRWRPTHPTPASACCRAGLVRASSSARRKVRQRTASRAAIGGWLRVVLLVALHSDFDWLMIARSEFWQVGGVDGESDGSGDAGLSCDEAGFFER